MGFLGFSPFRFNRRKKGGIPVPSYPASVVARGKEAVWDLRANTGHTEPLTKLAQQSGTRDALPSLAAVYGFTGSQWYIQVNAAGGVPVTFDNWQIEIPVTVINGPGEEAVFNHCHFTALGFVTGSLKNLWVGYNQLSAASVDGSTATLNDCSGNHDGAPSGTNPITFALVGTPAVEGTSTLNMNRCNLDRIQGSAIQLYGNFYPHQTYFGAQLFGYVDPDPASIPHSEAVWAACGTFGMTECLIDSTGSIATRPADSFTAHLYLNARYGQLNALVTGSIFKGAAADAEYAVQVDIHASNPGTLGNIDIHDNLFELTGSMNAFNIPATPLSFVDQLYDNFELATGDRIVTPAEITYTPPISAVAADGWQATMIAPADLAFEEVIVSRQGFTSAGGATTIAETLLTTKRVRQPYPNQGSPTASSVALSDYVYSTDTIAGVTNNNSAEISPKPFAAWVAQDRLLVGNSIYWEINPYHRNARSGRMVACVEVRATDGTNTTAWQAVSATAVSSYAEGPNPIEVFAGTLDVTALNTGLITMEARVKPWIGGTASILGSSDQSARREFSARYFLKNVARAASPPLAYIASTGNDSTGVWSTNAATAAATPFLTVGGALMAVNDATRGTPATGGVADGGRIRIVDTVNAGTCTTSRPQNVAGVIVERAPGTARASAIVTHGADMRCRLGVGTLTAPLTEGCIVFTDLSINRTGAFTFLGEAATQLDVRLHNVNSASSSAASARSQSHLSLYGVNFTASVPSIGHTTGLDMRMTRGVTGDLNNAGRELFNEIGCNFTRPSSCTIKDATKPVIRYNNRLLNPNAASSCVIVAGTVSGGDLGAVAEVQNLIEATHTTTGTASVIIAADGALGNIVHAVIAHNAYTGYFSVGRSNLIYDEAAAARFHKLVRHVGNIHSQLNTKGDVFTNNGARLGQFAFDHGVACQGNFSMFRTNSANASNEMQGWAGINSNIGTSTSVRNDPGFTSYQGTGGSGGTPSAGAGGGNYLLTVGASARTTAAVPDPVLAFDIAGNARAASNDAPGAFA